MLYKQGLTKSVKFDNIVKQLKLVMKGKIHEGFIH